MRNKKGFLLAEETLKIILAVIALGILAYLLFSIYQANRDSQNLELARESLSFLSQEINSQAVSVEIYNPKGWTISSWPNNGLRPLFCSNLGWESCICICDKTWWHSRPFQAFEKDRLEECNSAAVCLENTESFEIGFIDIKDPPITLNIDYDNKEIS
jgi:type II secretory pathway pseudopilin PulG